MVDNWYYTKDIIDLCYTKYIKKCAKLKTVMNISNDSGKITIVDFLRLWLSTFGPHNLVNSIRINLQRLYLYIL